MSGIEAEINYVRSRGWDLVADALEEAWGDDSYVYRASYGAEVVELVAALRAREWKQ